MQAAGRRGSDHIRPKFTRPLNNSMCLPVCRAVCTHILKHTICLKSHLIIYTAFKSLPIVPCAFVQANGPEPRTRHPEALPLRILSQQKPKPQLNRNTGLKLAFSRLHQLGNNSDLLQALGAGAHIISASMTHLRRRYMTPVAAQGLKVDFLDLEETLSAEIKPNVKVRSLLLFPPLLPVPFSLITPLPVNTC